MNIPWTRAAIVGLLATMPAVARRSGDDDDGAAPEAQALSPLHAERGERAGVYDDQGRQVLLRGVNLNALGDYHQANPDHPPVAPFTEEGVDLLAEQGFDVVRLVVSWSALEPERDQIDEEYLAEIERYVGWFAEREIYVVLDMHQDAWGRFIASPPGTECEPGTEPAIGWDGAPEWATFIDGATTCRSPVARELSPAVATAWESFYEDREGIRDEFVEAWAELASRFAHDPTIVGYDLLNEPNLGLGSEEATVSARLGALYVDVLAAIRAAEDEVGAFPHIAFFEGPGGFPRVAALPPTDWTDDPDVVFAPHLYTGSIDPTLTPADGFEAAVAEAGAYRTTFWVGEWGWFGDPAEDQALVSDYAALEDRSLVGGAWWQWQQACGDPHTIGTPDGEPGEETVHYLRLTCPGDDVVGPVERWADVLTRAYPRAAPGRLTELVSDWEEGTATVAGTTEEPGDLDLWVPDRELGEPVIEGDNVGDPEVREVPGGWRILVEVPAAGDYRVELTR